MSCTAAAPPIGTEVQGKDEESKHCFRIKDEIVYALALQLHAGSMKGKEMPVEHAAKDFSSHDQDGCIGIDGHVPRHQAHIVELFLKLPELLIAERLHNSRAG